jgi:hypothetical protein
MNRCSCWTASRLGAAHHARDSIDVKTYSAPTKRSILFGSDRGLQLLKAMPLDAAELRVSEAKGRRDIGPDGPGAMDAATISNMRQIWHAPVRPNGSSTASSPRSPLTQGPKQADSAHLHAHIGRALMDPSYCPLG